MLNDPQILVDAADALRDRQYAPTLAGIRPMLETPFASSWKGAEKPEVVLVEFYDYACPYCKASNPHVDQLVREKPGPARRLPRASHPRARTASRRRGSRWPRRRPGRFSQFHDALYAAGRPAPETNAVAARVANIPPKPSEDAGDRGRAQEELTSSPASSAQRERPCSSLATGC